VNEAEAGRTSDWRVQLALLAVLLVTFAVYAPVLRYGFVEWDDPSYVTENVHVSAGLSVRGAAWALTSSEYANWHPLTWLSHMADVSLYGLAAGGHHLTSLLLHLANTWLLFIVMRRMTRAPWKSLAVATLFALHPLHVESVAWVSERKDVLSTMFWMLALWAYARFAERPSAARYAGVAAAFALGLMAKPMLVSLPLTLLILDVWPLARAGQGKLSLGWPRVLEKLPLVVLSLGAIAIAWMAQRSAGAITDTPVVTRLANTVLGTFGYLEKMIWPAGLCAFYPYDLHPPLGEAAIKAVVLVLISAAVWRGRHRPWLLAGWLWYVVTLAPVSGLIRIGQQQMADRYSYVPLIGVFVMLVWGASALVDGRSGARPVRQVAAALGVVLLVLLALGARRQVTTWENGITLWQRAIAVGGNSTVSQNNLGVALREAGRLDEAAACFLEATQLEPRHARAHANLGSVRFLQGRFVEAIEALEVALSLHAAYEHARLNMARAQYNLANASWRQGQLNAAEAGYREAIRWDPGDANYHRALGLALVEQGRHEEAESVLRESLRLDPEKAATHDALAIALFHRGDFAGAWREVQACRQRGGTPTASLLELLPQKMPEPR
jgi:Flp pilus assembly protein TadD